MADDADSIAEGMSRLKAIRESKKIEEFLSKVNVGFKPVIDTEKDRKVTDDVIFQMTAAQHIERLTGKHAFVGLFVFPFS